MSNKKGKASKQKPKRTVRATLQTPQGETDDTTKAKELQYEARDSIVSTDFDYMRPNVVKESQEDTGLEKLQHQIYKYKFWIALFVSLMVVIGLYYFGKGTSHQDQLYSIAASLVASICFAVIFTLLANKEFHDLIRYEIGQGVRSISDAVTREINELYVAHNPSGVYMPTAGVDRVFNAALTKDLKSSSFYLFRGISAKYVPCRVMSSRHHLSVLKVIILDPRDSRSIGLRARDRKRNPKYAGKSMDELASSIRKEIYMSVIALFDCRDVCPVEIAYGVGTSVVRFEIFDEALYMSLYHTDKASELHYPETIRYSSKSVLYNLYTLDTFREFDLSEKQLKFNSGSSEGILLNHLREIGLEYRSSKELTNTDENSDFSRMRLLARAGSQTFEQFHKTCNRRWWLGGGRKGCDDSTF